MTLHTRFISSYNGRADYGVYSRRLDRDVRVTRDQATDVLSCASGEVTPAEATGYVAAVRAFLEAEHIKFLAWCEEKGIAP